MVLHPILFYHYCKNTKITTLAEKKRKGQDSTKLNMMFLILAYSLKYLFMCMHDCNHGVDPDCRHSQLVCVRGS